MKWCVGRFLFLGWLLCSITALAASEEAIGHNKLGTVLFEQGKLDAAIAEFRKAISLDVKNFPARLNLAYTYEKMNRAEDATETYREAINVQPESFFAHNNLGVLYDKQGFYDSAITEFETALRIETNNDTARKNLEIARNNKSTAEKRQDEVLRAENEAKARPNDPNAAYNLARLHANRGNKDAALVWLAKAIEQGYKDLGFLRVDPVFQALREDPAFEQLLLQK